MTSAISKELKDTVGHGFEVKLTPMDTKTRERGEVPHCRDAPTALRVSFGRRVSTGFLWLPYLWCS